jgi:zinc/manganese transport system substrate-binding protein
MDPATGGRGILRIILSMLRDVRQLALATAIAAAALAGCGEDEPGASEVRVVATTTQAADLARAVGGDAVEVTGLLQPGSDAHDYEPRPSDARAVAAADLVIRSGGEVDEWLGDVAGGDDALVLSEAVRLRGEDPHWWQDPRNGLLAVDAIGAALADANPAGAEAYARNARRYSRRLRALDREIARCIDRLPPARRRLVTTHDALGYYADRYGLEVIGALIPSLSSQAQPSAGEIQELVDQIRAQGVEAVFPESSLNPGLERAVAREAGAEVGGALYADALGPEGSAGETYLGSLAANTEAIVEGLSGGRLSCRPGTRREG